MSEMDELQAQADAVRDALAQTLAEETGLDVSELDGLDPADLADVREQYRGLLEVETQERESARVAAIEAQAALEGMTSDEYQRKVTLERAMQHARDTGNWSEYLRVKASDARNIDRTTEQGPGQHRVSPWWTARKEEQR